MNVGGPRIVTGAVRFDCVWLGEKEGYEKQL